MCPDQQLFSIYVDNEVPSPWKEKLESHLAECPVCREKYENFRQLRELFKKDTDAEQLTELAETAKDRIWQKLAARRRYRPSTGLWHRKISIPLPAAAAAAVIITLMAGMWIRGVQLQNNNYAIASQQAAPFDYSLFSFAVEDGLPVLMPDTDLSAILQYLASDGTDTINFALPENRNFSRTGEPGIIRAADYTGR